MSAGGLHLHRPMRRLILPLQAHELRLVEDGGAILAPFHPEAGMPCAGVGCPDHRRDFVAVVVRGDPNPRLHRTMERLGKSLRFNSLDAGLTEEELQSLLSLSLEESKATKFGYSTDDGEMELLVIPSVMWRDLGADSRGWGGRVTLEELLSEGEE